MIRSFRSKALENFFLSGVTSKLPIRDYEKLERLLDSLNAAKTSNDMRVFKNFHKLTGCERWAVNVSANYRLTWAWEDGPESVDIEDYH